MQLEQLPFLQNVSPEMQNIVLRILVLILALLIFWLLRGLLSWLLVRPLRARFSQTESKADDALLKATVAPVRLLIVAFGIYVSTRILEVSPDVLIFTEHLTRTIIVLAVLLFTYHMVDLFAPSSRRLFALTGVEVEDRLVPFLRVAFKFIFTIIAVVIVIQEWGYDITGLIAGIGVGGLAVSLAAQDTLSNLFGFTAIVGDRPFNVGDYIRTSDVEGVVEHVGLRSTRVRQLDQALVMVPNNKLAQSAILNWSRLVKRRVDYVIGLTYDTTSDQMRTLLERIRDLLRNWSTADPATVQVFFTGFGDSSLNVMVRVYVKFSDWGEYMAEQEKINLAIMDIVEELGLSFAFPSRSVYVENVPAFANPPFPDAERIAHLSPRERAIHQGAEHPVEPKVPHGDDERDSGLSPS